MDSSQQSAFVWRLVAATTKGKIKWEAPDKTLPAESFIFRTRIGRFGYLVKSVDRDDYAPFEFEIYQFESDSSKEEEPALISMWSSSRNPVLNDAVQTLYQEIKRNSAGYDNLIRDMYADLAEIDGESPDPDAAPHPF